MNRLHDVMYFTRSQIQGDDVMPGRTAPDLSHLSAKDLVLVLKESNLAEIEKNKAFVASFMDRADAISRMDTANVDKIAKLMDAAVKQQGDGGCGNLSGGCC